MGSLLHLVNLNLKGNPVTEKEDYKEKVISGEVSWTLSCVSNPSNYIQILALIPSLRVLDGERFDPKFLQRRQKQKAHIEFIKDLQSKKQRVQEYREKRRQKKEKKNEDGSSEEEHVKKGPVKVKSKKRSKDSDRPNKRPKVAKK